MYCCRCSMASTTLATLSFLCLITSSSSYVELYNECSDELIDYDSEMEQNVNMVLSYLTDNADQTGFTSAVYGQESPNKVFGRFQCRGDLSPSNCSACSEDAVKAVGIDCPGAIGAHVQLEDCFLRYENYSFLSQLDTNRWYYIASNNSNTDTNFNATMRGLMADLAKEAPANTNRFAVGQKRAPSSNVTVYGMEMCWKDMSTNDCSTCLSKGIEEMSSCCNEKVGVQVFLGSCTLRYEIFPFAKNH